MNMNGRRRLTWVTALTVASLLLGGGALNALAEGHGGGNGDHGSGGGQGKSDHQQQTPVVFNQAKHDGESHVVQQASPAQAATTAQNTDRPGQRDDDDNITNVQKNKDEHNNNNRNVQKHEDEHNNNNVQRRDDDDEDLVTPPARVTDDDRPGLGCGDDNHTHTGAPGNPDKMCKPHDGDDEDQAMTTDDASAAVNVAGVTAENDDQNGD